MYLGNEDGCDEWDVIANDGINTPEAMSNESSGDDCIQEEVTRNDNTTAYTHQSSQTDPALLETKLLITLSNQSWTK